MPFSIKRKLLDADDFQHQHVRPERETMRFYEMFECAIRHTDFVLDEDMMRTSAPAIFTNIHKSNMEWLDIVLELFRKKWLYHEAQRRTYLLRVLIYWQLRYDGCVRYLIKIHDFINGRDTEHHENYGDFMFKSKKANSLLAAVESRSLDAVQYLVEQLGANICTSNYADAQWTRLPDSQCDEESIFCRAVALDNTSHIVEYLLHERQVQLATGMATPAEYDTSVSLDKRALARALDTDLSDLNILNLMKSSGSATQADFFKVAARYTKREPEKRLRDAQVELELCKCMMSQGANLLAESAEDSVRLFTLLCFGAPAKCVKYLCEELEKRIKSNQALKRKDNEGLGDVFYQSVLADAVAYMLDHYPISRQRYDVIGNLLKFISDDTQLKWLLHSKLSCSSFDYYFTLIDHEKSSFIARDTQKDANKCVNDTFELLRVLYENNLVDFEHCLDFMTAYFDGWLKAFDQQTEHESEVEDQEEEAESSRLFIQFNQLTYMLFDFFEYLLERECVDMRLVKRWWNVFILKMMHEFDPHGYLTSDEHHRPPYQQNEHLVLYLTKINSYIVSKCLLFELKYARSPRTLKFLARSSVKHSLKSSLSYQCLEKLHLPRSLELYLNNNRQ